MNMEGDEPGPPAPAWLNESEGSESEENVGENDMDLHFEEEIIEDSAQESEEDILTEMATFEPSFDKKLSARHSYLGDDLVSVDGNTNIVEEDTVMRVPLSRYMMVLVPGQTVPMTVFFPMDVAQMLRVRHTNKTLGFVYQKACLKEGCIGTTAVIQSFSIVNLETYDIVKAILQGKQRFRVKKVIRNPDMTIEADVVILKESPASHPLQPYLTPALSRIGVPRPTTEETREVATPAVDASGRAFRFRIPSCSPARHRLSTPYVAVPLGPHPAFIYRQYDHNLLMDKIRKLLKCWNASWAGTIPFQEHPVEFSYWLIQSMPVSEEIKYQLLSLDHYIQRLRACLSILKNTSDMVCEICGCRITSKQHIINLSDEGSCKAFVNPGGVVHEMMTVQAVSNVRNVSGKNTEHSWYPGYAWTIIQCSSCNSHLGWKFTTVSKDLQPAKFWGITRKSVRPKFVEKNWRPII